MVRLINKKTVFQSKYEHLVPGNPLLLKKASKGLGGNPVSLFTTLKLVEAGILVLFCFLWLNSTLYFG